MGYSNDFTGEITFTPPLTWAEIQDGPLLYLARNRHTAMLTAAGHVPERAEVWDRLEQMAVEKSADGCAEVRSKTAYEEGSS
jgi:hypothetical protein